MLAPPRAPVLGRRSPRTAIAAWIVTRPPGHRHYRGAFRLPHYVAEVVDGGCWVAWLLRI